MSVEAYEVRDINGEPRGAVLICNTTGLALPIPHGRFLDAEQGEAFLQWLERDARSYSAAELDAQWERWIAADSPGGVRESG